ncbi:MAG TPA: T9SS type A sorting domain-containing protein, partial [Panacibacter sp.]|nr:T9SS type A sorting domain-containing protein [Panacibacter sp.]
FSADAQNILPLNGSVTDKIETANTADWWSLATGADGKVQLTFESIDRLWLTVTLYDNDGTTILANGTSYGKVSIYKEGLLPGTYKIKVYSGVINNYNLSDSLIVPLQQNDNENNNTPATAEVIAQNQVVTGHIGYYYNHYRDSSDWYKFTTVADGKIKLILTSHFSLWVTWKLYDFDGITELATGTSYGANIPIEKEGLQAGTYYARVTGTNATPYTLTDSLIVPAQANDIEPNGSKDLAYTIAQDQTLTGHIGYYWNHRRDSSDWYKFTTNADGKIKLILTSHFSQWVTWKLYDGNGSSELATGTSYGTNISISKEGLQAGTYYARVMGTNATPYTFTDSLIEPAQANDYETNNVKESAQQLNTNNTTTGHLGYYYNGNTDTDDWYFISLPSDGKLNFTLINHFAQWLTLTLYDNNGTTVLYNGTTYGTFNVNKDGLAAGTYYIKLHAATATPYTLTDSLNTYNYAADAEPNNFALQAKTIPSNGTVTGHSRFYYNNIRETPDWFKINYTGSDSLFFTIGQEAHKDNGSYVSYTFQLYKDTAAPYIVSKTQASQMTAVSVGGLAPGYYYIKIYSTNSTEWLAYSISNSFVQVNIAQISLVNAKAGNNCNNSSLQYKCSGSNAPYNVRLYRYGIVYGNAILVNDTAAFMFGNLPPGNYYTTVFGDGATGNAYGTGIKISLVPKPINTSVSNITSVSATLGWVNKSCITQSQLQYRPLGTPAWIKKSIAGVNTVILNNLAAATSYEWRVAAVDTGASKNDLALSAYTAIDTFTTASAAALAAIDNETIQAANSPRLLVYPNPVVNVLHIQLNGTQGKTAASIKDANGKTVWIAANIYDDIHINVSRWLQGLYFVQVMYANNKTVTQKIIINR